MANFFLEVGKVYGGSYAIKDCRKFTEEECATITGTTVFHAKDPETGEPAYHKKTGTPKLSACFFLIDGTMKIHGVSIDSKLTVNQRFDPADVELLTLAMPGKKDCYKIR